MNLLTVPLLLNYLKKCGYWTPAYIQCESQFSSANEIVQRRNLCVIFQTLICNFSQLMLYIFSGKSVSTIKLMLYAIR